MENRNGNHEYGIIESTGHGRWNGWIVVFAGSLVFLVGILAPPRLVDDVDAVQATIARNMLTSGDWVTARLDGVADLEKIAAHLLDDGRHLRSLRRTPLGGRLPLALARILLCWVTYRFGRWAFNEDAGLCAGLSLATGVGLFLFTRILIPDAILTLTITGAIWAWLRLLEPDEAETRKWSLMLGLCMGCGLLLKGLIAVVFPVLAGMVYMAVTRQLFSWTA